MRPTVLATTLVPTRLPNPVVDRLGGTLELAGELPGRAARPNQLDQPAPVFGHRSIASLLRELGRNPALLATCGFDPLPRQSRPRTGLERDGPRSRVVYLSVPCRDSIPSHWNFSRFVRQVVEHETLVQAMVERLGEELMEALPDFGEHLGYDGKAIESHSTGRMNRDTGEPSDRDADWGRHETHGVDARTGTPWTKVKSWSGYGLHLMADTHYDVPVAYRVTPASHSEVKECEAMVEEVFEDCPGLARMRTRVGVALAVMMALALGHVRAGRPERVRSLFAAVAFADTG